MSLYILLSNLFVCKYNFMFDRISYPNVVKKLKKENEWKQFMNKIHYGNKLRTKIWEAVKLSEIKTRKQIFEEYFKIYKSSTNSLN